MKRVALIVMPFAAEDGPALGPSLLQAALRRQGDVCDLYYLNLKMAAKIGLTAYRSIDSVTSLLLGEWLFSESLFEDAPKSDYVGEILRGDEETARGLEEKRRDACEFIEECRRSIAWEKYDIVGFSSSFQQNVASLALARRLKADHPHLSIVMGGANCEGEMGEELLASFPFLDAVFSGESDITFPAYNGGPRRVVHGEKVTDLDALPIPDFTGYYDQLLAAKIGVAPDATHLRAETSRGCWWGERAHCTFCGLNGQSMGFRRKSTARALEELESLTKYPTRSVMMADNILDEKAFDEFIPALAEKKLGLRLFYEIKASLTREQIALLARAGIRRLQPGIESLSTETLGRMRKGTRAIENIALLRWAAESGIALTWNLLTGFPRENPLDHERIAAMIPSLMHLQPPTGLFEVQVHRFAPFHFDRDARGIGPIRAAKAYAHIYPFDESRLSRLAYFFDRTEKPEHPGGLEQLAAAVTEWRQFAESGRRIFVGIETSDGVTLFDSRSGTEQRMKFGKLESRILSFCSSPQSDLTSLDPDPAAAASAAERLVAARCLLHLDGRYLALPMMIESAGALDPEQMLEIEAVTRGAQAAALHAEAGNGF